MSANLSCPHCGSSESLATTEQLTGYAGCTLTVNEAGEIEPTHDGYTDIDWDSSRTTGYWCKDCGTSLSEEELRSTMPPPPERVTPPKRTAPLADVLSRSAENRRRIALAREVIGEPPFL